MSEKLNENAVMGSLWFSGAWGLASFLAYSPTKSTLGIKLYLGVSIVLLFTAVILDETVWGDL